MRIPYFQLKGAAAGMLLGDLINMIYIVKISLNLLEETPAGFLASLFIPPKLRSPKGIAAI